MIMMITWYHCSAIVNDDSKELTENTKMSRFENKNEVTIDNNNNDILTLFLQ